MLWSANVTSNAELYQNTPAVLPLGDVVVSSDRQVLSLDGLTGKIKGAWGTDDPPVKALDWSDPVIAGDGTIFAVFSTLVALKADGSGVLGKVWESDLADIANEAEEDRCGAEQRGRDSACARTLPARQ